MRELTKEDLKRIKLQHLPSKVIYLIEFDDLSLIEDNWAKVTYWRPGEIMGTEFKESVEHILNIINEDLTIWKILEL